MAPEEIERSIRFVVDQQAQFAANSQKHDEQIGALTSRLDQLAGEVGQVNGLIGRVAEALRIYGERANGRMDRIEKTLEDVATGQKRTEEHLNILTNVVDQIVRDRRRDQP